MPVYLKLGSVPAKRHIRHDQPTETSFNGEGLAYEHVVTTAGFDRAYSITYHKRPPTRVVSSERVGQVVLEAAPEGALQHHHFKSFEMPRKGGLIDGRVPLLFNEDVTCYRCRPTTGQAELYRNGSADEVIFVFAGKGRLETPYGTLDYRQDDYIVIPRGTTYQLFPEDVTKEDHLILESAGPVRLPHRYLNPDGQIMMGAPFYERDFHGPSRLEPHDDTHPTPILVKDGSRLTRVVMAHHPFDVIGWDGFVYPYTFNAMDFEPLTGTVHLPPPYQQTFECKGFVICTFAPRYLDHHPKAIKVPYVHSNTEADEVLFYCRGNFGSRKGISAGSISHHPAGIPHGPHPGTIAASFPHTRTEELAVMFDTEKPLLPTVQAMAMEDPRYSGSWLETSAGTGGSAGTDGSAR